MADYVCVAGQPYIYLPQDEALGGLSISHDGEYVVAMAMVPPRRPLTKDATT